MHSKLEEGGTSEAPPPARSSGTALRLGGVVLSALSFNWLSELWSPSTPLLMLLVIVSLTLLTASDSGKLKHIPALNWITSFRGHGLVELGLLAIIIGFGTGLVTLIPLWPTASYSVAVPAEIPFFDGNSVLAHNYEFGAIAAIVLMVAMSAFRAPNFQRQAIFLGSAVYGLALALSYLRPNENDFFKTLIGSFFAAAAAAAILVVLPRLFPTLRQFWGIDQSRGRRTRKQADSTDPDSLV